MLLLLGALAGCVVPAKVQRPAPEVGWPVVFTTNKVPALPFAATSLRAESRSVQTMQSQSVVVQPAPRRTASLILSWRRPLAGESVYNVYTTNGTHVMTVPVDYNNCTVSGLYPGERQSYYVTAVVPGDESDPSNSAGAIPTLTPDTIVPKQREHVFRHTWQLTPGVTNALQSSTNLTTWTDLARVPGTNGVAAVFSTNNGRAMFFRIRPQTAITQTVTHVLLSWTNAPGVTQRLDREAHAPTGSYVPVLTNTVSGTVSVIQPAGAQWRVFKLN